MSNFYESMVILKDDVSQESKEEVFSKITKKIEALGGVVSSATIWAKERNFAFILTSRGAEKKKFYKGCYWLVRFSFDVDKLADLKETMRLEERILRNMILRVEPKAPQAKAE